MQIIITGGAGFLGQKLAKALVTSSIVFDKLILVDKVLPSLPDEDVRIQCLQLDLTLPSAASSIINTHTGLVFHLAAVVSSQAEKDFELGWSVNLDITRNLLETCRRIKPGIRFVFASSLAVYGGPLPEVVNDSTALTPRSSYGIQKTMGELLINEYSRKGFIDGRALRLPTVCIRPGKPNQAASSFVSSIIREPLNGEEAICPVSEHLALWLSSPETVIKNIIHSAILDDSVIGSWRSINLPGMGVTIKDMIESLEKFAGPEAVGRIKFIPDAHINNIVSGWPGKIDNTSAIQLGFTADKQFDGFIEQFIQSQKK